MNAKGFESIGRLLVPKRLSASDGSVVPMTTSGWISRSGTLRLLMAISGKLIALAPLSMILLITWALLGSRSFFK